ncbi:MAG: hypothetical protein AB1540_14135, partial [Bdellovibrionota bacterium]
HGMLTFAAEEKPKLDLNNESQAVQFLNELERRSAYEYDQMNVANTHGNLLHMYSLLYPSRKWRYFMECDPLVVRIKKGKTAMLAGNLSDAKKALEEPFPLAELIPLLNERSLAWPSFDFGEENRYVRGFFQELSFTKITFVIILGLFAR